MPIPPRRDVISPGLCYHVYSRGNDGRTLFLEPADYSYYLSLVCKHFAACDIDLFHYALMPNHVHLLLRPNSPMPAFSNAMMNIQRSYAQYFAKNHGLKGHLWSSRFKSKTINDDAQLFACGNYIEMNPVRAGLVSDPSYWPYSSYRLYALGEHLDGVVSDPLYDNLGPTDAARQKAYAYYVSKTRR